jgi:hypothetical protein
MAKAASHFDSETIALMKNALGEAWGSLPPKMQATMLKTTLAERILKSAAEGERSRIAGCGVKGPCRISRKRHSPRLARLAAVNVVAKLSSKASKLDIRMQRPLCIP